MVIAAQNLLVLQDGFGRIPVIDLGNEPPPGPGGGLDDTGVSQLIHRLEGGFRGKRQKTARCRHPGFNQRLGGQKFAAADFGHLGGVDGRNPMITENFHGVQCPGVIDTAFDDHIDIEGVLVQIEKLLPVVDFD